MERGDWKEGRGGRGEKEGGLCGEVREGERWRKGRKERKKGMEWEGM